MLQAILFVMKTPDYQKKVTRRTNHQHCYAILRENHFSTLFLRDENFYLKKGKFLWRDEKKIQSTLNRAHGLS